MLRFEFLEHRRVNIRPDIPILKIEKRNRADNRRAVEPRTLIGEHHDARLKQRTDVLERYHLCRESRPDERKNVATMKRVRSLRACTAVFGFIDRPHRRDAKFLRDERKRAVVRADKVDGPISFSARLTFARRQRLDRSPKRTPFLRASSRGLLQPIRRLPDD